MISIPLLLLLAFILFVNWLFENFGAYLRLLSGCLLFVLLTPVVYIGLIVLRDFLIDL